MQTVIIIIITLEFIIGIYKQENTQKCTKILTSYYINIILTLSGIKIVKKINITRLLKKKKKQKYYKDMYENSQVYENIIVIISGLNDMHNFSQY